jgi:trehalose transport system substrate-binding protein
MDLLLPFMSDLIAGLVGAAILAVLALFLRRIGTKQTRSWADRLRRLGWPVLAAVFLITGIASAVLRGTPMPSAAIFGGILVAGVALVLLFRFGPAELPHGIYILRRHIWPITTGFFLCTTILLLTINPRGPAYSERIVFVVNLADEEMMVMRDLLDELEPRLGADIFMMNVDSSRYIARLDGMVASGNMKWDLIALDNNMTGILAAKGLVEELSNHGKYDRLVPSSLLPAVRPLLECEGKFYFAPFRPNVKIAFYNETKFNQYGLRPPMTWEELLEVAKTFKEQEGVGRVAIQGYPGPATAVTVFEFVMAAGGDPTTLNGDGAKRAFTFLKELEPYLAVEYAETRFDTANELLIDDQVYLVCNWTYGIKVVVEDAGKTEIKAYRGWRGPQEEVHVLGGDVLAVPKGAPHPEEAVKLIELLLEKETQKEMLDRFRWLPVRFDAYEGVLPELEPYFKAVNDTLSFTALRPNVPTWPVIESLLDEAFRGLVEEQQDISSLQDYRAALNAVPSHYLRYVVQTGDTLELVANHHGTTVDVLAEVNCITTRTPIAPGQIILIPD